MNILVIGSGGREHALIKAFSQSPTVKKIYCAPGNAGIAELAEILSTAVTNHEEILNKCREYKIDFVFIGPEDPLVNGLSDSLRAANINVVGPSKEAAQLEGSKIFAKKFMERANIPTAKAVVVNSVQTTLKAAAQFTPPYILKADGLAAGKGVFICADLNELKSSAENIFEKLSLGEAGKTALLEQNLPGKELSFLILTNGESFQPLPLAQDHKRLLNANKGPNTGGMGTVAPLMLEPDLYEKILTRIIKPSVDQLKKEQLLFRGILFIGIMLVENEPYVLEYNVRFGDPETQVILPLLENDVAEVFYKLSCGQLTTLQHKNICSFCIVNAAAGYPDNVVKNTLITLPKNQNNAYILHAGTARNAKGELVSAGGRVLNIVATANSLKEARDLAYSLNNSVTMDGRQFRTDLGEHI